MPRSTIESFQKLEYVVLHTLRHTDNVCVGGGGYTSQADYDRYLHIHILIHGYPRRTRKFNSFKISISEQTIRNVGIV